MEDHDACNLIALSVGSVMRQSLDDGFKGECKKLLQATNTKMAEEILYKKLMETVQAGSRTSTQDGPPGEIMPTTSSTDKEEAPRHENAPHTTNSNAATSVARTTAVATTTQTAISCTQRNIRLGEMYCRMIQLQKRSLSPQLEKSEPQLTMKKGKQNSAPF